MSIQFWPQHERPREKLLQKGADYLSDAELLAICLRVGVSGKSAVDLAREMLNQFGSLQGVFNASLKDFHRIKGLGTSKYCLLQATLEMAKRCLREDMQHKDMMDSPKYVSDFLCMQLGQEPRELFYVLFLDAQNRLVESECMFQGTLTQTSVYPREVVRRVLYHNAASVIFAHNHPSGIASPSEADKRLTQSLKNTLGLVDVRVLDHFVVAGNTSVSFAQLGLL